MKEQKKLILSLVFGGMLFGSAYGMSVGKVVGGILKATCDTETDYQGK